MTARTAEGIGPTAERVRTLEAAVLDLLDRVRRLEAEAEQRRFAVTVHASVAQRRIEAT